MPFKETIFNHLSLSPSPRSFWSSVKKLTQKQNQIPTLHHNDISASTSDAKANLLNNFFAQSFNPCTSSPLCLSHSLEFSDPPPYLLCTPEQVLHLIHQLPTDTSPGPDGISSKMLKSTTYSISHPLSLLFNQSISFGTFPSEWKCSHITSISKSTSPSSPSCYRSISLLYLVSKLLENMDAQLLLSK